MDYSSAQQYNSSVTYGWRIATVSITGPSNGKLQAGDIIIGLGNQTIKSNDDLASYLEEYTLPGDDLTITLMRNNTQTQVHVTLGERPAASS
jgi:S1-C subfamily serine protease